jgi:hypothetical protein
MSQYLFDRIMRPLNQLERGSAEWVENMSYQLQNRFNRVEQYGSQELISILKELFPERPWDKFPVKKPWKRADTYFEKITGKPWTVITAIVREFDTEELADRITAECNPGKGDHTTGHDNVMTAQQGNSRAYTLNRLKREQPDLFEEVVKGEMSANAAAIKAGFRKKLTPLEQFARLWAKASTDERQLIREFIDSPVFDR